MKFAPMLLLIGVITLSVGTLTSPLMPWWHPETNRMWPLLSGFVGGWGIVFIIGALFVFLTED